MSRFTRGFITGVLIGGAYTLLNAKQSGKETREAIKAYVWQVETDARDVRTKTDNLKTTLAYLTNEALPLAQQVATELQVKLKGFQSEIKPRVRRISEKISELSTDISEE